MFFSSSLLSLAALKESFDTAGSHRSRLWLFSIISINLIGHFVAFQILSQRQNQANSPSVNIGGHQPQPLQREQRIGLASGLRGFQFHSRPSSRYSNRSRRHTGGGNVNPIFGAPQHHSNSSSAGSTTHFSTKYSNRM